MGSSRGPRCSGLTGAEQGSRGGGELRSCGGDGDGDGGGGELRPCGGELGSCCYGGGDLGLCEETGVSHDLKVEPKNKIIIN